jgi:hypothetical protein
MTYSAEISRDHPTAFLFVIDQSESMEDPIAGGRPKAEFVADVLNKTLYTLVTNCSKAEGIRRYFDIGVLSYSGEGIADGFGRVANGQGIICPLTDVAEAPLRVEERTRKSDDGAGGLIDQKVKFPIWFEAKSVGRTPMRGGLTRAAELVAEWCDAHPDSYPPTILHVTDGESTDGDPQDIADAIRKLHTGDGQALLFNLHVSTQGAQEVVFARDDGALIDDYSRMLFRMSSPLPPHLASLAGDKGYAVTDGARGFIFNADPQLIVDFFEIGTRPRLMAAAER